MLALSLQGVSKSFVMNRVLDGVDLTLEEGSRTGLVGVNGSGKSTLLKIIAGELAPDEGAVSIPKGTTVGLLTQHSDITEEGTVLQELSRVFDPLKSLEKRLRKLEREMGSHHKDPLRLAALNREYARITERFEREGGYEWPSRIQGVLAGLGFAGERQDQPARLLSGGEKTRLCLARVLLMQPDLLLLDEPTNHLDLPSTAWLEETLKKYRGTVLLISHDRYFLNQVCDGMAELSMTRLHQYRGNYEDFVAKREENLTRQLKEYKLQQAEIARHEAIIARYRSFNREKSIIAARSWEKKLERIRQNPVERPMNEQKVRFSFDIRRRPGDDVLIARGLAKGFEGRSLFHSFDLHLRSGDRVALIGANGVGKTTLLRILMGQLKPDAGNLIYGANVDVGYYDQQQEGLHPGKTVMSEVWDAFPRMEPGDVRSILALFLFTGEDVHQPIETLSGGEKGRVALAKLMLKRDNLLLLDEPTNHLDMDSREVLEHALDDFPGTILAVSHDRYFINRVCNRVVEMSAEGVQEYLGNYDDYVEKKRRMGEGEPEAVPGRTRTEVEKEKRRERLRRQSRRALEKRVEELEQAIFGEEEIIKELDFGWRTRPPTRIGS
ncbi:MAG: ABC-F family ATP-binding cassette domain-containing protein [Candidatus Excrementavichristensenella sp.]|jgi:ATP-binding cassette subfamily F protein 3